MSKVYYQNGATAYNGEKAFYQNGAYCGSGIEINLSDDIRFSVGEYGFNLYVCGNRVV